MRKLLTITSIFEATLGVLLILFPSFVINLVFGINANVEANLLGHFSGIVFLSFGLACFPLKETIGDCDIIIAVRGMFAYNAIAGVFFGYLKFEGLYDGILLLPAFVLHTLIALCFIFLLLKKKNELLK